VQALQPKEVGQVMPWIESHTSLARHPKTLRLARILGIAVPAALGHLHLLWWWAIEYAPDGGVGRFDAADLALACMWDGDEAALLPALQRAGFVDQDGNLHDWHALSGKWFSLVERSRRYWADYDLELRSRVIARDGLICQICGGAVSLGDIHLDHIVPRSKGGPTTYENLRVTHSRCNRKRGNRV
jgi:hypothetical protein